MEQKIWFGAIGLLSAVLCVWGADDGKLLGAGARSSGDTDYCAEKWQCSTFKHLMCEFKKNQKTELCSKIEINISSDERMEILELVNEFRNNLAGGRDAAFPDGAKNMQQVTWDFELESFAEVYGSQCGSQKVPELDFCAKTTEFEEGARQLWGTIENDIEDVVTGPDGWASVVPEPAVIRIFEPVYGPDRLEPNYGRFTMLAWAKTYKIGCSVIACTCESLATGTKKLVCFLGPSGNIRGKPVFFGGEACKSCPEGTACNANSAWSKLCARKGDPTTVRVRGTATSINFRYVIHLVLLVAAFNRMLN